MACGSYRTTWNWYKDFYYLLIYVRLARDFLASTSHLLVRVPGSQTCAATHWFMCVLGTQTLGLTFMQQAVYPTEPSVQPHGSVFEWLYSVACLSHSLPRHSYLSLGTWISCVFNFIVTVLPVDIGSFPNTVWHWYFGKGQSTWPPKIPESSVPVQSVQLWHCVLLTVLVSVFACPNTTFPCVWPW